MKICIYFSCDMGCKLSHKSQNTSIRVIDKAFGENQFSSECLLKCIIPTTEKNVLLHVPEPGFAKNMF